MAIDSKIEQVPTVELFFKKGIILKEQILYPEALEQYNLALKIDSANVNILSARADINVALGDYPSAVEDYSLVSQLQPDNLLSKFDLGKTYMRLTDYKKAYETFDQIYQVDSTNVIFNKNYAHAAYKASKYKRAIYLYEKYLMQNSNDIAAYLNLARSYSETKQITKGLAVLHNAHDQFKENRSIHLKLASSLFANKKYEPARNYYESFMQKHDTTLAVLLNYGICLYQVKEEEKAIEVLEECYQAAPNDPYVNFYLGVSHKKLDHYELAAKYIDFAIYITIPEFHPDMYHHLAQIYGSNREFEKSIEAYKKAYELDNRKVEVLFEIATTYEEYNFNKTMALNYYRSYLLEAGEGADNSTYALERIRKIKEDLFFEN